MRVGIAVGLPVALVLSLAGCSGGSPTPTPIGCRPGFSSPCPDNDPFYKASAQELRTHPHGSVLKTRSPFINDDTLRSLARATTVLYASTDIHDQPIAASETVLTPKQPYAGPGRRPILSYQIPYDSLSTRCEPSYQLQHSSSQGALQIPLLDATVQLGWTVVVPDYEGPQALFAIGPQQGRTILDGIRATEQLRQGGIDRTSRVMMWGYSGGALGSAWASEMQPTYAADLNVIGVAEGGLPSNLKATIEAVDGGRYSYLGPLALAAMARAFPGAGITEALNPDGKRAFDAIQDACSTDPALLRLAHHSLRDFTTQPGLLNQPKVDAALQQLNLGRAAPQVPIYNYQGVLDQIVPFTTNQALVRFYCSQGVVVDHVVSDNADHVAAGVAGVQPALQWLTSRVAGTPSPNTCHHG